MEEIEEISSVTSLTNIMDIKYDAFGMEVGRLVDEDDLLQSTEDFERQTEN